MSIPTRITLVVGLTLLSLLAISAWGGVGAAELTEEDFVPLATQGFLEAVDGPHPEGSLRISYMWSMRWWRDKLYVGTQKDVLCFGAELLAPTTPPPEECELTPEQRADIWAYTPGGEDGSRGTWEQVFQSPLLLESLPQLPPDAVPPIPGIDLTQVPQDVGYRNMLECHTGGREFLYMVTFGVGGRVVYTPDGTTFLPASILGLNPVNDLGYRALACWKGRLWISPTGSLSITGVPPDVTFRSSLDNAFRPVLLVNDDPSNRLSPWRQVVDVATDPQLGDAGNQGIYSMAVFADALYLGVTNSTTGFEIWKADATKCHEPPGLCVLAWEKLIDNGGGRPIAADGRADNERIFDFDVFNGHLYWGAAAAGSTGRITTPEMGRIGPDGRWDLIVGEPRDAGAMAADPNFNCQLEDPSCVPLSGKGPGFGPTPLTQGTLGYIWQFEPHKGVLYAGVADASGVMGAPVPPGAVPGADLWRSHNGTEWSLVNDNGFGNPCNVGVRTMASSPFGLFVGTANVSPTGCGIAGGTAGSEVWLGIDGQE
jgi:hypothetical protein